MDCFNTDVLPHPGGPISMNGTRLATMLGMISNNCLALIGLSILSFARFFQSNANYGLPYSRKEQADQG
jgi:hypothetical protein